MADTTEIAWCDSTFNPWIGCTKVSPGCDNCYAAAQDKFRGWTPEGWGGPRKRTSAALWRKPELWNDQPFGECSACGWRGETRECRMLDDQEGADLTCPKCGHIGIAAARRRVFCASLADVFDNQVPREWRADLFRLIHETQNLDWLLLTKRIGNAAEMMFQALGHPFPLDNVWLGATVVNQEEADRDIPKLLATRARVRFLSMEPLLGDVDLSEWLFPFQPCKNCPCPAPDVSREGYDQCCKDPELMPSQLHWIIPGAESGTGARPAQLNWIRDIVRQAQAADVAVLVKQLGREVLDDGMSSPGQHWPATKVRQHIPRHTEADPGFAIRLHDRKGGDWSEWPEDLRVRQFPEVSHA